METTEIVTQILNQVQGALLESCRFGRSESALYRVSDKKLQKVARALKDEAGFDWLENLSAMQMEEDLVFTYFLRKTNSSETLIVRTSVPITEKRGSTGIGGEAWVEMDSLSAIWPMAILREAEISRLFGVRFSGTADDPEPGSSWDGFPLRKSFDVIGAAGGAVGPGGVSP